MKKILMGIGAFLLLGTPSYALEGRSMMVKLGYATGEIDTDTSAGDEDLETKISVGLEYIFRWENGIDAGIGASFEKHELSSSKFDFGFNDIDSYPVFGVLRYRFKNYSNWTPYVYGNLGYAFVDEEKMNTKIDSGMYYGMGVGIEYIENLGVELGWARTEFDGEIYGESIDPVSDLIKLSIVMRLDH